MLEPNSGHPSISVSVLRVTYAADSSPLRLPGFAGATLRGALGGALRELACTTGAEECGGCLRVLRCPYGLLWESAGQAHAQLPARFATDPPKPYAVSVPYYRAPQILEPGEEASFVVRLFGASRALWPHIVLAARDALRGGLGTDGVPARLVAVDRQVGPAAWHALYTEDAGLLDYGSAPDRVVSSAPRPDERARTVRVTLLTPLALKREPPETLDPVELTARAGDRLDLLSTLAEDNTLRRDHRLPRDLAAHARISAAKLTRVAIPRNSRRSGRVVDAGLLGHAVITGVFPEVLALWRVAEALHVGRHATFGFGQVVVEAIDE